MAALQQRIADEMKAALLGGDRFSCPGVTWFEGSDFE